MKLSLQQVRNIISTVLEGKDDDHLISLLDDTDPDALSVYFDAKLEAGANVHQLVIDTLKLLISRRGLKVGPGTNPLMFEVAFNEQFIKKREAWLNDEFDYTMDDEDPIDDDDDTVQGYAAMNREAEADPYNSDDFGHVYEILNQQFGMEAGEGKHFVEFVPTSLTPNSANLLNIIVNLVADPEKCMHISVNFKDRSSH